MGDLDFRNDEVSDNDKEFEQKLRPLTFNDFRGQAKIVENLQVFVTAAKMREEALLEAAGLRGDRRRDSEQDEPGDTVAGRPRHSINPTSRLISRKLCTCSPTKASKSPPVRRKGWRPMPARSNAHSGEWPILVMTSTQR